MLSPISPKALVSPGLKAACGPLTTAALSVTVSPLLAYSVLFGFCSDSLSQQRECSTHGCVNRIEETVPFGQAPTDLFGLPDSRSRGRLRSVDGFGDSGQPTTTPPAGQEGIGDLSQVGSIISDWLVHGGSGGHAPSTGSADLRSPITQDPCSKAITFISNIDIDTDGRGNTVPSRTELPETSFQSHGQSLNSDGVNFIVMPGNCGEYLGHYASVTYRGETVYGIVGDCGPAGKTGEVSTAMAKELSDKLHSKRKGQGVPRFTGDGDRDHFKGFAEDGAVYTIYPQGVSRNASISSARINTGAREAESFAAGCGQKRHKSSLSDSMRF